MQTPILGQSYVARSINAADNRMVNLFPEATPENGKTIGYLNRAPGLKLFATVGNGPIRGLWAVNQYMYVVSGQTLYKVTSAGVATSIGFIGGITPVSMADNGTQIFIAANPNGYIYNVQTNVLQQINDVDFPGAVTVGFIDGYFVFNEPNSQRVWITGLYDGTTVDPLEFASAEGAPDNIVAVNVNHREVWLFGTNSVEVWYNSGDVDFPLTRIQGSFNELGCAAPYSIAKLDNVLFWLGRDARGYGIVYRARGYVGERISTHAIEYAIQSYGDISNAIAYSYQQEGHLFYVLTFPTASKTWVFDSVTGAWHERAGWVNSQFTRHRSNCQVFFNNLTLVGDYQNGNVYSFDLDVYDDNGDVQKWLRSWRALPPNQNDLKRTAQHSLQLDAESGVGLNSGQGSQPQVLLRWSDDGGHTWSNQHSANMGAIGEYGKRMFWRRLGMTVKLRDRVYEISGTDPVKIAIMGANLILDQTNS